MELIKTKDLAEALNLSKKAVLEKAEKGGWAYVQKGNSMLWVENRLPTDIRFAVATYKGGEPVAVNIGKVLPPAAKKTKDLGGNAYLNANDKAQGVAQFRSALIYEYKKSGMNVSDFLTTYNHCDGFPALYAKLGEVSQASFYRWLKNFKENGASGIVPKYGMSRGGAGESLTDEERDLLKYFWLRNTQPSAMHAYRLMKENLPYSSCTYQTALRFLNSIPKMIAGRARQGEGRFENLFLPHMEQDLLRYKSMDVVVSDHHCLDCVVMYHGQKIRPWITTFQDLRSGMVLGWCPCVKPSSISIVAAYYMTCIQYGVPKKLLFDNGKDYRSKWLYGSTQSAKIFTPEGITEEVEVEFEGLFHLVGSEVHFTRTYNGKSKARQERFFRIIGEYLAKDMGTYVGSDSRSRPDDAQLLWRALDGKEQRNDIPEWEDFVYAAMTMLDYINNRLESTGSGMEGKTRHQVFMENLPPAESIKHPSKELLQKALMKGEIRHVGRNGVKVGGVNFWALELGEFFGNDIRVYKNLTDAEEVTCCTLKGELICTARANYFKETGNLTEDLHRLENARKSLTLIAETGSSEVKAAPEYENMIEVSKGIYEGKALGLNRVDSFIEYDEPEQEEPKVACDENRFKKSNLKNPLLNGSFK